MINMLLWVLIIIIVGLVGWGVLDSRRLYRFTVLFAISFFGFVIPQLNGLSNETAINFAKPLPEGALDLITFVCILCVVATWLGDNRGVNHPGTAKILHAEDYDNNRLIQVSIVMTVAGVAISQITHTVLDRDYLLNLGNQWSGPITILMFFQSMQKYGLAVAVLAYLRTRAPLALLCALFNVFSGLIAFAQVARRGAMADIVFMVILGLYFGRRLILPAWLLGVVFVVGTLWSHAIGGFRTDKDLTILEKLENAEFVESFKYTWVNGGEELRNGAFICIGAEEAGEYDFGKIHWNQLVHGYFPGQIFGHDLKRAIKFEERKVPEELYDHRPPIGTTETGMADSFRSFWYFGCLKYYIIGYVMGRWWNRGNRGDLRSQLAYMSLMAGALHTITHGTWWLLNAYIHMMIFAYPALYWARIPLMGLERPRRQNIPPMSGAS